MSETAEGSGGDAPVNLNVPMKSRKCILIVDDDKDVLLFLGDRLTALG
jgi:hypothetical protein